MHIHAENGLTAGRVKSDISAVIGRVRNSPVGRRRFERRVLRLLENDNRSHFGLMDRDETLSHEIGKAKQKVLGEETGWTRGLSKRKLQREKREQAIRDGIFAGAIIALFGIGIALDGAVPGVVAGGFAFGGIVFGYGAIAGGLSVLALLAKLAWNARHGQHIKNCTNREIRFEGLATMLHAGLREFEIELGPKHAEAELGNGQNGKAQAGVMPGQAMNVEAGLGHGQTAQSPER